MADQQDPPLSELLARCEALESALLREKIVIGDAIEAHRPGGVENAHNGPLAWLDFYAWLNRTHALGARSSDNRPTEQHEHRVAAAMSAALAEAPEEVECSDGETRYVYPKSLWALQWLEMLNRQAAITLEQSTEARKIEVVEDVGVLQLEPLMLGLPMLMWAWIVTHKGPELPFDDDAPLIDPPTWTKALSPDDFFRLLRAHRRANGLRLNLIAKYIEPEPGSSGGPAFSVAGFVGSIAGELEPDAGRRLMRKVSLGQIFATRVAAAAASRESMRRAKEQSKRPD